MAKIKIDLHKIYNNGPAIEKVFQNAFDEAISKKIEKLKLFPVKEVAS